MKKPLPLSDSPAHGLRKKKVFITSALIRYKQSGADHSTPKYSCRPATGIDKAYGRDNQETKEEQVKELRNCSMNKHWQKSQVNCGVAFQQNVQLVVTIKLANCYQETQGFKTVK